MTSLSSTSGDSASSGPGVSADADADADADDVFTTDVQLSNSALYLRVGVGCKYVNFFSSSRLLIQALLESVCSLTKFKWTKYPTISVVFNCNIVCKTRSNSANTVFEPAWQVMTKRSLTQ